MNTSTLNRSHPLHRPTLRSVAPAWIGSLAGIATLTSVVCLLGAPPAWSDTPATRSVTVSFRDLDLSSVDGTRTLYRRIQSAARQVCGQETADAIEQSIWRSCYRNAIADAVDKVNSPLLTAVHAGRPPQMTAMLSK